MSLVNTATSLPEPLQATAAAAQAGADAVRGQLRVALPMRHAGTHEVELRYELRGPEDAPVVFVAGGISAHRHVSASASFPEAGWANALVAAGRALDPARLRVLAFDYVGADGRLDVPIDTADQADAIALLLDALGIARLQAFVGYSYGAMVGLQFAARHPTRLARLVAISGAHRSHPQVTALRVVQRRIVALGRSEGGVREALALARALAVIGYRSDREFEQRFAAAPRVDPQQARFAVEDYFDAIGPRFVARFCPTAYLRLSESIDLQQVDPAAITVPTDLVAVREDQIVPEADLYTLVEGLRGRSRLHRIESLYGHDAFLKEEARIGAILRDALSRGVSA